LWQEPELRAFLVQASSLTRLPRDRDVIEALQTGAASAAGVPAAVGLWDEARAVMRWVRDGEEIERRPGDFFSWRAFDSRRPTFSGDLSRERPQVAAASRGAHVEAAIAAPIQLADRRYGALVLYSERAPIFADDDVQLAQLLADQCAIVLESRRLGVEAAEARAKEEAARLKEDFISAAAHDLKTPLTTLVAQAQTLERRMRSGNPPELSGVERIAREAKRLQHLVEEMLEASRIEQGALQLQLERVDLIDLVHDVTLRHPEGARVRVEASGPAAGRYDRARIERLVENLVENAAKYSPPGVPIDVRVHRNGGEVLISVTDHGIGIPPADQQRIFQRFERATNVNDRSYPGTGLGLYICRGIAEGHGGRIWVESAVGAGSTFHVALPATEGPIN
jgi:signal transduction histidine kinase